MFYTIYRTTNLLNGKFYVGKHQTLDLKDAYIGSGKRLWNAIRKHGIENFKKEILFVFESEAEMNAKEAELVTKEFCEREDTYNICEGGSGGWSYVNREVLTPQIRKFAGSIGGKIGGPKTIHLTHTPEVCAKRYKTKVEKYGQDPGQVAMTIASKTPEAKAKQVESMRAKNGYKHNSKAGSASWSPEARLRRKLKRQSKN